ncbi:EAL domain-containing protein [Aromatoleum petrolei]|uniref:EAL domain-containing protein n=2 Tax=Aromatoleum petrolei TaxID=76116 RepID=A0ABX1MND4_9RHOO|nr:EAL domain-containing protein [Aromatoleum petrolei]QTQ38942.1 Putative two component system response regulator, CheY-like [Aromatoleum petrolei]
MNILLIDDDPIMLRLLAHQLSRLGAGEVTSCERARDALVVLDQRGVAVDLIFCDLQMPEMDGVEFVRQLVRIGFTGCLVLVSGEDARILQTAERLARAHRLDVLGGLQKPVSPIQLQQLLAHMSDRPTPKPRAHRKRYSAEELRLAIAGGQLINHYQPKVAFASGAITGVETLVRWDHPEDGLVFPDQFIDLAEECGLIDALTQTVLDSALKQARRWQAAELSLPLAVNVSMDNLTRLEFPELVEQRVAEAGIAPSYLTLEVTESRLMKNRLESLDILTRLRLKRFGLSIDDFGTGHSSLVQLRDIPFTELKIDRDFVRGAPNDASARAILEASLSMAQQLGMTTVAEGVEDLEDWDFLRARGVDVAQGWFIAKPMPADDLSAWIAAWELRRPVLLGRPQ